MLSVDEIEKVSLAWIEMSQSVPDSTIFDDSFWAYERLSDLLYDYPEDAWLIINSIRTLTTDDEVLANLAAGPLENLLAQHGDAFIERFEVLARKDPSFSKLLGGVWLTKGISEEVWLRLRAVSTHFDTWPEHLTRETDFEEEKKIAEEWVIATTRALELVSRGQKAEPAPEYSSVEKLVELCMFEPEIAWSIIQRICLVEEDDPVVPHIGEICFWPLLSEHGNDYIDRIVEFAKKNKACRKALNEIGDIRITPSVQKKIAELEGI